MNPVRRRHLFLLATPWLLGTPFAHAAPDAPEPAASTPEAANAPRVAIVSLLSEEAEIHVIGLTVFNNDKAVLDLKGELGKTIEASVTDRLQKLPTPVRLVPAVLPAAPVLSVLAKAHNSMFKSGLADGLAAIARASGADALVVVGPNFYSELPMVGSGVVVRRTSGNARACAAISVGVYDAKGRDLWSSLPGSDYVRNVDMSEVGLYGGVSSLDQAPVREQVKTALLAQMRRALASAMERIRF